MTTEEALKKFDERFTEEDINGVWTVMERKGKCGGTALSAVKDFIKEITK